MQHRTEQNSLTGGFQSLMAVELAETGKPYCIRCLSDVWDCYMYLYI